MSDSTKISWADATWNVLIGCSRVSAGCQKCYAEVVAHRGLSPNHRGLTKLVNGHPTWTGEVRFVEKLLELPLRWKKPRRIFVNSLSDMFHEQVKASWLIAMFDIMAQTPRHTYQILTKRPQIMWDWMQNSVRGKYALPNVWLGVSVEDQDTANERIPMLLETPAAVRFVSYEPALGPAHFTRWLPPSDGVRRTPALDLIIVGGESGPQARLFDLAWARNVIEQCRGTGVSVFIKQIGAHPWTDGETANVPDHIAPIAERFNGGDGWRFRGLRSRAGSDPDEWPKDLRIQEMPI